MIDMRQQTLDQMENARAWRALTLRHAKNTETVDHLTDVGIVADTQTGETENDQTVSPERTGTGDVIAAQPAGTLAAIDTSKIAGAVAGAGVAAAADAIANNNVTAQATALIDAIAGMYGLKVAISPAAPAPAA